MAVTIVVLDGNTVTVKPFSDISKLDNFVHDLKERLGFKVVACLFPKEGIDMMEVYASPDYISKPMEVN